MKKLLGPFCLTLIIFIGSVGVSESADFQKGLDALQKKDYATALREWKPLAEKGTCPCPERSRYDVLHRTRCFKGL